MGSNVGRQPHETATTFGAPACLPAHVFAACLDALPATLRAACLLTVILSTARGSAPGRPRLLLGAIDLLDATYAGPDLVTDCSTIYVRADDPTRPNDDDTSMVRAHALVLLQLQPLLLCGEWCRQSSSFM